MEIEIITEREPIEKIAEDMFHPESFKFGVYVDYADLCTCRRLGTFNKAILCRVDIDIISKFSVYFKEVIASLYLEDAMYQLFDIIVNPDRDLSYEDVLSILNTSNSFPNLNRIWALNCSKKLSLNEIIINVLFAREKRKEDKVEDEKMESVLSEYRTEKHPIITEFPEFTFEGNAYSSDK